MDTSCSSCELSSEAVGAQEDLSGNSNRRRASGAQEEALSKKASRTKASGAQEEALSKKASQTRASGAQEAAERHTLTGSKSLC